jgi:hypothetical protein
LQGFSLPLHLWPYRRGLIYRGKKRRFWLRLKNTKVLHFQTFGSKRAAIGHKLQLPKGQKRRETSFSWKYSLGLNVLVLESAPKHSSISQNYKK